MDKKVFRLIKIVLSVLIILAILNDIIAYIYFDLVWQNFSDFIEVSTQVALFLLAGYLVYTDNFLADFITFILAFESLDTVYQLTPTFSKLFSLAWLKIGLQVLLSNILMTALLIMVIIHFILLVIRKTQNKNPMA